MDSLINNGLSNVDRNGHDKIENFFSISEKQSLINIHKQIFNSDQKRKYNNRIVELDLVSLKRYEEVYYLARKFRKIISNYFNAKFYFSKVWFEKKIFNVNTDENYLEKLPYVPHIDKYRFLKIMIYLDKVDEINGAIQFCEIKPNIFETNRINLWKNSEFSNVIEDKNLKFKSISGEAGDLVIFDTNCPHKAGTGNPNEERNVIRLDYEMIDWNKKNFFSKAKLIYKNL